MVNYSMTRPDFQHGMTPDQRYRAQELYRDRPERPLDVYDYPESSWTRFDYNHTRESKIDDYHYRKVDRSGGYGNWRLSRGYSRGRYRGEEKGRQDRGRGYWNKRGQYTYNKMQGKRPCDVTVDRHEKKRRLNLTESSVKDNFESRSHGGRKSPSSRESSRSADSHRYRESSKDRKVMSSGKSDSDRIHSTHSSKSCKRTADSTSEHSTMERLGAETERSKSKEKIMTSELNFTSELSKQKKEEEKKKEKTGCENAMVSVSSTTCTSVLKSVSMDRVLTSNTKSVSKGPQSSKPTSKCENLPVVHTKPKLSLKTGVRECSNISSVNKSTDTTVKGLTSSGMSSNFEAKRILPKIPKIPSKNVCVNGANSGSSKNVSSVNGTKESSKKQHHRHSVGSVPLQLSKKPLSSGTSLDKKQQNKKKKHRHSSGHVTETSPKNSMMVSSKTISEVTSFDVDHDASLNFLLSERDDSLPHLVHKKRHKRMSGSISPPRNSVVDKAVDVSGLFHEDGICGKEDGKKTSKTVKICEKEENQISKTTSGKENVEQSSSTVDKNLSKSSVKSHERHKVKVKCHNKKTILNPKGKVDISGKPIEKEKVHGAAKNKLSVKKMHTKHVQVSGGKKNKLGGSDKKEGTGKELNSMRHHDQSSDMVPVVSVKKVPSEVKRDKTKTTESHPLERAEVESSVPSAVHSDKDSVSKSDRMSLFDLFKDSSEDQPQQKSSKLSVKRTPDSKHSKRSPTKSNIEREKNHHSKRKIEDKLNKVLCKKAKICYGEEVLSSEKGNTCPEEEIMNISKSSAVSENSNKICDTVDSEMEKVSSSTSSCPTTESDILSSGPLEKDLSIHYESDLSINSSGRHMDESGSAGTSFSLSSCMTSPSFNKSDTLLSDDDNETETSSNMSKLKSEQSLEIQSLVSKNLECDSSKNMSSDLCDRQETLGVIDNASESEDDGSDRLVIDLNYTSVPLVDTAAGDTAKNETECFKLPKSKHEKNPNNHDQKQKEQQSEQHTTSTLTDDYESSQDEMMDTNMNDFVDKDDIRLITYNEGDIECPWTPMPPTPYVSNSQEDDMQEDVSLPEENCSSPINEGEEIAPDQEKEVNSVEEKETVPFQEKEIDSHQEKDTNLDKEDSHQEKNTNLDKEAEIRQIIDPGKENNEDQERDKNPTKGKEADADQMRKTSQDHGCSSGEEQLEQKANILASLSGVRPSSDADSQKGKEHAAPSNEFVTQSSEKKSAFEIATFPVSIKQEPVSIEDSCITKHIPHSQPIRGAAITRSSSADHLTLQNHESSKPSIMRSQSVGGESNQSLLRSCQGPNISLNAVPPCAVDAGTKVPNVSTPASGSDAYTISDSYTATHINLIVNSGKLNAEQQEFVAKIDKSLDLLSALGSSSMQIPLKHDKFFTDGSEFTSFGNFSPKHLTPKNMMRCIECKECLKTMSPREFIEHLCGSVQHKQFDMEKLVRTTFEFCTNQCSSSDTCARVLLIIIFKLERSLFRSFREGSACQTVSSPTDETHMTISPRTTPSTAETTSCVESRPFPEAQKVQQPALSGLSSVETSLITNLPSGIAQSSSSALPTPQENCPPTTQMIEDSISKSLAVGEYLSNIQGVDASQPPRKGTDNVLSVDAWSQGSVQQSLTECTTQVGEQPLQQNGMKSVAPLAGIGQLPTTSSTSFSISEINSCRNICSSQLNL
ncbi:uncharacterized protein LOC117332719 isoform X2 [Pecten maximus]|uniref:uncharacterized protein LOC117332719 isoform X2 n=1 Tax=Pecten maximus TaxID=6579 RepID=UPI001458F23E|nr:uncharacterized protein LOC117332719 isoform X2 [Pecten maximus]